MHVTLVTGVSPKRGGASGTLTYVLGLARHLVLRGIRVSLVTRDGSDGVPEGVQVEALGGGSSSAGFLASLLAMGSSLGIPEDSIIHAQRPDDLAALALAGRRNPKVCTLHGNPSRGIRDRKGAFYGMVYRELEWLGLRGANRVIFVDRRTREEYVARYPWLANRANHVPTAVDTDAFRPMNRDQARVRFGVREDRVLLFAGRLSREKRVDTLIEAVDRLPRTELLIAGTGREEAALRDLARGRRVRFLGAVPRTEMPLLMNAADLFLLPSAYEGLPSVILEAFACGLPVAATPVGDVPEIVVPGRTGWLIGHREDLAGTLELALPDAGGMARACIEIARRYSWTAFLDSILEVYREATEAHDSV